MLGNSKEIIMSGKIIQLPVSHPIFSSVPPFHSLNSAGTAVSGPTSALKIYAPFLKKCSVRLGKLKLYA